MFFLIVNSSGEDNRVALMWNTNPAVDAPIKSKTGEKHESKKSLLLVKSLKSLFVVQIESILNLFWDPLDSTWFRW